MFALTSIKGIGRRLANIVCQKADVDMNKRLDSVNGFRLLLLYVGTLSEYEFLDKISAGELSAAELENLMVIVANPRQF
ncbi:hypothetical protein HHK36_030580 [Tetracentron sinense]|uniref:Ribosomal protein S13 n=1 Tax=Tetracentron sinense TaxID=13715 RepID=A0A834YBY1_TETSI|nr:hypothetical protein HHK36_030580 [Tetracentron sinense]